MATAEAEEGQEIQEQQRGNKALESDDLMSFAIALMRNDSEFNISDVILQGNDGDKVRVPAGRAKWLAEDKEQDLEEALKEAYREPEEVPEDISRGDTVIVKNNEGPYIHRTLADEGIDVGDELDVVRAENGQTIDAVPEDFVPRRGDYAVLVEINEEGDTREYFYASHFEKKEE